MKTHSKISVSALESVAIWRYSIGVLMLLAAMLVFVKPAMADVVNINKATAEAFQQNLQGIGPVKAQAIVDYRKKNGPFKSVNDLKNVPGIGKELIKTNKKSLSTSRGLARAQENKERNKIKKSTSKKSKSSDSDDDEDAVKEKKIKKETKAKKDKKAMKDKKAKKDKKAMKDKKAKKDKKAMKDKKAKKVKKVKKSKKDKKSKK